MPVYHRPENYQPARPASSRPKAPLWRKLLSFVGVPVLFFALTSGVLYLAAAPTVGPYVGLAKYMFSKQEESQPANLYEELANSIENATSVPFSQLVYPSKGDQYGQITIEGTSVDAPLYYGDSTRELNRGVATYADTVGAGIPGENMTVLLAGHNNTFFNGLQDVQEGSLIHIDTHYGSYVYRVTGMKLADYQDTTTYDVTRTDENLILYTCYPFDAFGFTPERYFVYAEYVSGPMIDKSK